MENEEKAAEINIALEINKKSRVSKTELLTILISVIAAAIALFSLFEAGKQRRASLIPVVQPLNTFWLARVGGTLGETNPSPFADEEHTLAEYNRIQDTERIQDGISFLNIGVGTAVDVRIIWDLSSLEQVTRYVQDNYEFDGQTSFYFGEMLKSLIPGEQAGQSEFVLHDDDLLQFVYPFVLPVGVDDSKLRFSLPAQYFDAVYTALEWGDWFNDFPLLSLQVSYRDAQSNPYVHHFALRPVIWGQDIGFSQSESIVDENTGIARSKPYRITTQIIYFEFIEIN